MPARRLVSALHRRVDSRRLVRAAGRPTPVKTRILAGGIHSAKQQVVRIDRGVGHPVDDRGPARRSSGRRSRRSVESADAVLVSDYGTGLVEPGAGDEDSRRAEESRTLDSRADRLQIRAPHTIVGSPRAPRTSRRWSTPLASSIDDDLRVLERAGRAILERTRMQAVLITRGSRGMALFVPKAPTVHIPIFGSDEIADVTGAGIR